MSVSRLRGYVARRRQTDRSHEASVRRPPDRFSKRKKVWGMQKYAPRVRRFPCVYRCLRKFDFGMHSGSKPPNHDFLFIAPLRLWRLCARSAALVRAEGPLPAERTSSWGIPPAEARALSVRTGRRLQRTRPGQKHGARAERPAATRHALTPPSRKCRPGRRALVHAAAGPQISPACAASASSSPRSPHDCHRGWRPRPSAPRQRAARIEPSTPDRIRGCGGALLTCVHRPAPAGGLRSAQGGRGRPIVRPASRAASEPHTHTHTH